MNELHLFAGAGGGILGGILLGHTCVCAVEIEPYCREVLFQRQRDGILPKFPIWDDVKTFDGKPWRGKVDVVCGGFPCQDISCAGKGAGIEGEKSGLWREQARIISEVRPPRAFIENVPTLTIRGGVRVLNDLANMGYNARWGVVGADNVGLPIIRKRLWIYATNANCLRLQRSWKNFQESTNWTRARKQLEGLLKSEAQLAISAGKDSRMSDGITNRVDRLKAVGNIQVPSVVKLAWEILSGERE